MMVFNTQVSHLELSQWWNDVNVLQSEREYLGIVMQASSVFVYMTGLIDRSHYFAVDGYTGQTTAEFKTWAMAKLNSALGQLLLFIIFTLTGQIYFIIGIILYVYCYFWNVLRGLY